MKGWKLNPAWDTATHTMMLPDFTKYDFNAKPNNMRRKHAFFNAELPPRKGEWIQTFTGKQFWVTDPMPYEVDIRDIAHALANITRFGGHTERAYSVAQHSLWVSRHCPEYPLVALLHDATEAYLGDMVRPLKASMFDYQRAEARVWLAIARKFFLPYHLPEEVHIADRLALVTERRDLLKVAGHLWHPDLELITPDPEPIRNGWWDRRQAEKNFLKEFEDLTNSETRVYWEE